MPHTDLRQTGVSRGTTQEEKRVGLWIRVSTEEQAQGESPEHHEARGRMYAEMKGWIVAEVYHLEGVSGKSVLKHPETQRMMADVERGRISGLIFSKLERLGRNAQELLSFADFFQEHGADLISLAESIDTSTPHGRFFYTNLAALAQLGREETAYRVAASVPIRAKLGKSLGGAAPFGFQWENRQLIPDPKEGPIRKRMYELFSEHKRLRTVARLLNEAGYRTRNGSKFTDTTVKRLIRDPTAKGVRRANYTRSTGDKKHWVKKPESEWVFYEIPAIVSPELWEECNRLLDERSRPAARPTKKAAHLFSGHVFCTCGERMYVPSNTPKYVCKECRTKIPEVDVERLFQQQLKNFFFSPEAVSEHLAHGDQVLQEKQELLSALQAEHDRVTKEMARLYRLYMGEHISPEGFGKNYRPLEERLAQLQEELPRLQAEVDFLRIELVSREELVESAQDLYTRWFDLPFEERRTIVESLVDRITVGGGEVSLSLLYLPASPQIMANEQRTHIPAFPLCNVTLRGRKPRPGYPEEPEILGEHLKKRRLDLSLTQKEVAAQLGVNFKTYENWEQEKYEPEFRYFPAIIRFLGYDPSPEPASLGERIKAARRREGISQQELARKLALDPSTVWTWETGQVHRPLPRLTRIFEEYVEGV